MYGSYWNRIIARWGDRQLDELTPSEIQHMLEHTKTHAVTCRNARGGRGAAEHPALDTPLLRLPPRPPAAAEER